MKVCTICFLSMLFTGCAARDLRCDGKLTAINAPAGASVVHHAMTAHRP